MEPLGKTYFVKINGKRSLGKQLEILVDGSVVEKIFVQPNLGKLPTHVRIIGSDLFDETLAFPLKDTENYVDIIEKIEGRAEKKYSNRIRRVFSKNPQIEIRVQKSYSLM